MRPALILALLLGSAAAQGKPAGRGVNSILADHAAALGPIGSVGVIKSRANANLGKRAFTGVTSWRKEGRLLCRMYKGPFEYVGEGGVFFAEREAFYRFRENQEDTCGGYYAYRTLAEAFPLRRYLRNPLLRKGLKTAFLKGLEVLRGPADRLGYYPLYFFDPKTHLLRAVRFEKSGDRRDVAAVLAYKDYRRVGGVMLPGMIEIQYRIRLEDEQKKALRYQRAYRTEQINKWELNAGAKGVDFKLPGLGRGGAKGFARTVFSTGTSPYELATGDFDGDGKRDIAVACDRGLAVHFGGELKRPPVFVDLAEGQMRGIVITDMDLDGRSEVLTMSRTGPPDSFFLVSFDERRTPKVGRFVDAPQMAFGLLSTDFDRDGIADYVATSWGGPTGRRIQFKFGNGVGGFRVTGTTWPLANARNPMPRGFGLAVGRLDRDGLKDVVVADGTRVRAFMGRANLSFFPGPPIEAGPRPVDVCLADLDGDGDNDLVVANELPINDLPGDLAVLLNTGATLKAHAKVEAGRRVSTVRSGHFNADRNVDIVATSYTTGEVTLLYGDGKGNLGPKGGERLVSGRGAHRLHITDFDGDGRDDILCANHLDDSVTLFLNRRKVPPPPQPDTPPVRAEVVEKTGDIEFKLEGLSWPFEFAGEFRLPAHIRDPSGLAWLGGDSVQRQLVLVSDKEPSLFRLTLDRSGARLLVGPRIPLSGHKPRRLDLEGLAFDHESGNLFLASESGSTILRANLFGQVFDEVPTGIANDAGDGIEALAFRRRGDGTPLLYLFKERLGRTLGRPPVLVFGFEEDPFGLVKRAGPFPIPVLTPDQTGAAVFRDRMLVQCRMRRTIAEFGLEGDGFGKTGAKTASYAPLMIALGHVGGYPMGEALAIDAWGDLYLLLDNNGRRIGKPALNEGTEGRLLWFRNLAPTPPRVSPREVVVRHIFLPWAGAKAAEAAGTTRTRQEAFALAREIVRKVRAGAAFGDLVKRYHARTGYPSEMTIDAIPGREGERRLLAAKLPRALARLAFALDKGEAGIVEWHRKDSPFGYHVLLRIK